MKTLTAIVAILLLTHLTSCDNKTSDKSVSTSDTLNDDNYKPSSLDTVKPVKNPEITAIDFLIWYRDNRSNLTAITLVENASGESFDSTKFYFVNFQEMEKYLNAIKASGFVSSSYIDHWRKYFLKADKQFKANPQNDGPPENFDFDFILQSQEIDEDLKNIAKTQVISKAVQDDSANVILNLPSGQKLKVVLRLLNQKWLIDLIESATGR